MSVLEKIYESFIAGELSIQPGSAPIKNRAEIAELEGRLGLTAEQSEELEGILLDIAGDYGQEMFKAGFSLGKEMYDELSALDKSEAVCYN